MWFSLTTASTWTDEYYSVSLQQLYDFIVDFFEEPAEGSQAREQADALLSWWNQCVTSEIICISSSLMPFLDKSFLRTLPLPRPPGGRLLHGRHCGKNMLRWSFEFVCGVLIISVSLFQSNFFISYFFYWGARTHSNIKLHTTWGQPHMNGQGTMSRIGCHQSVYNEHLASLTWNSSVLAKANGRPREAPMRVSPDLGDLRRKFGDFQVQI
jgi:hypothetical protein